MIKQARTNTIERNANEVLIKIFFENFRVFSATLERKNLKNLKQFLKNI